MKDWKELKLGNNAYDNEEIILSKYKSWEKWELNEHYCFTVTSKMTSFKEQQTRVIWFDWDPVSWKAIKPLDKKDLSKLDIYLSSEDNIYGRSFMNKWHDGQVLKTYICLNRKA